MNNWGYKYTYYVYFKNEDGDRDALDGAKALENEYPENVFMGCSVEEVQEEPKDQIAT